MPIVNQLESLQNGITLDKIYNYLAGKEIQSALILVSCDMPATRKICKYILVSISYYWCEKKANYENQQYNFARMDDFSEWFIIQDSSKLHQKASDWRKYNSKAIGKQYIKDTGMRGQNYFTYYILIQFGLLLSIQFIIY